MGTTWHSKLGIAFQTVDNLASSSLSTDIALPDSPPALVPVLTVADVVACRDVGYCRASSLAFYLLIAHGLDYQSVLRGKMIQSVKVDAVPRYQTDSANSSNVEYSAVQGFFSDG